MALTSRDRILVVGTNGYVGSSIASALNSRFGIQSVVMVGSSRDPAWPEHWDNIRAGVFAAVCNVAGAHFLQPEGQQFERYLAANAYLPRALAQASASSHTPIFHVSSRWVLGERGEGPNTLYGATKAFGDAELARLMQANNVPYVVARIRETYGTNDPRGSLISALAGATVSGTPLQLTLGEQIADPTHVEDFAVGAANTMMALAEGDPIQGFFETPVDPLTVRQITYLWMDSVGENLCPVFGALPYRGIELFAMEQVHPSLPTFRPRDRGELFTAVYRAAVTPAGLWA